MWIDNQGGTLELKGEFINGSMVLRSELTPGIKVPFYYNQITWTENRDGSVTQLWQIYDEEGNILSTAFEGIYRKVDL
ncbi:MAG: hypothetical protein ACI837_003081 [Crocinitomicaceae bacterium]